MFPKLSSTALNTAVAGLFAMALVPTAARGQVVVPPTPGNQLSATVSANVSFDSATGLYTYSYTLTNAAASQQAAWLFALQFIGSVTNTGSPSGWTFAEHDDRPLVSWAATETGPLPPDYVDDGNLPPSPFTIAPGTALAGFRFQSPDPPANVPFFAQGDTKLPQVAGDLSDLPQEGAEVTDFTQDSFTGTTVGPVPLDETQFFSGGRRPAVDGFLVFLNLADGDSRSAPLAVVVKFGIGGETVDPTTFHATLNGTDVTPSFVPNGRPGELVGIFDLGSSPLTTGRNVLLTSVAGTVPGTTRTATDVDRMTLTVQ
jgi:hypothetical protein